MPSVQRRTLLLIHGLPHWAMTCAVLVSRLSFALGLDRLLDLGRRRMHDRLHGYRPHHAFLHHRLRALRTHYRYCPFVTLRSHHRHRPLDWFHYWP